MKNQHTRRPDLEDLVDTIYALKVSEDALNDAAKEIRNVLGVIERLVCMMWVQKGDYEPIRTGLCTGSPDVKVTVKTPKRDTEEYAKFCAHFGIDPESPFQPHWPSMLEKISQDMKEGKPIPPGCDPAEMQKVYKVVIRNKKPIEDGQLTDPELLKKQYELMGALHSDRVQQIHWLTSIMNDMIALKNDQAVIDVEEVKIKEEEETPF